MPDLQKPAANAIKNGLSVIPIAGHDWVDERGGSLTKRPAYQNGKGPRLFVWAEYQKRPMTEQEIGRYFTKAPNMALICGAVSGGLEVLDFDQPGIFETWKAVMLEHGFEDIVSRLVLQTSLTPGRCHGIYRCPDAIEPGRKIAHDKEAKCSIETRGEAQYILCAPSEGYRIVQGSLAKIPVFTPEERGAMLTAAAFLSETPIEEPDYRPVTKKQSDDLKPGEDFNSRATWDDILESAGWTRSYSRGAVTTWVRPGKERRDGIGACSGLGRSGQDLLRVHSTNAFPLDGGKTYDKFGAFTALHHGGDYSKAAKELRSRGYGQEPTKQREQRIDDHSPAVERAPDTYTPIFRFYSASELQAMPPKPMIVEGLLGEQDRAMVFGIPGVGKTFVLTDLLVCCTVGGMFAGQFQSVRPLTVVYCTNEGRFGYPARLGACVSYHGLSHADIEGRFVTVFDMPQLTNPESPRAIDRFVKDWQHFQGERPIDILVLDTLNKSTLGTDENSSSDAAIACDALASAGQQLGCASILVHHPAKATQEPRGASAFVGDMDLILRIAKPEDEQKPNLHLFKGKDIPGFEDLSFELKQGDGSAVVRWLGSAGFYDPSQTALHAALELMIENPSREWFSLGTFARDVPKSYDAIRIALQREATKPEGLIEKRGSGEGVEYRRRGWRE